MPYNVGRRRLDELGVNFFLKVPNHGWLRGCRSSWRWNQRAKDIFKEVETVYSATGDLWGFRLLLLQGRRPARADEGMLQLDTYDETAQILTNVPGIHALTAWRRYTPGAVGG